MRKRSMFIIVFMIVIGFAALSTTLVINGVVGIGTNDNNYIDGVVFDKASISSTEGTTTELSESGRTITFTTQEMSSIGDTAIVYFKIKNYSQYDATLETPAITCYYVDNYEVDTKGESISTTNEYMKIIPGTELDGTTILAGGGLSEESNVTVKQIKGYTGENQEIKFQCVINASAFDSETPGIDKNDGTYELTYDVNNNGEADVGDEITVGTESFYVISNTGTEINALAKYNLNVGDNMNTDVKEGIQDETAKGYVSSGTIYGNVAFSNSDDWKSTDEDPINMKEYEGPIKDALYGENGYESYLQKTIPSASVRLITKDELITLGCDLNVYPPCTNALSWVTNTSYWTGTLYSSENNMLWGVLTDGSLSAVWYGYADYYGIRPVITIK